LFKSSAKKTPWLCWVEKNQTIIFLGVIISFIMTAMIFFKIQKITFNLGLLLAVSSIISFFYVIRIRGKNMRELPFIKIHLISFTWVVVLILFPMLNEEIDTAVIDFSIAHYAYVLAVTIPFDIRDLKYDLPSQKTIPHFFGIFGAKAIGVILLLFFDGYMISILDDLMFNTLFHSAVVIQVVLVIFMNEKRSDAYCAGLIDGSIALLGLSYFLL